MRTNKNQIRESMAADKENTWRSNTEYAPIQNMHSNTEYELHRICTSPNMPWSEPSRSIWRTMENPILRKTTFTSHNSDW